MTPKKDRSVLPWDYFLKYIEDTFMDIFIKLPFFRENRRQNGTLKEKNLC